MQTKIDEKMLAQLAKLANLNCSTQELQTFTADLDRITTYFASLQVVQTEGLSTDEENVEEIAPLRDDFPTAFDAVALLKLAPERIGDLYRVPPILPQERSN